MLLSAAVGGKGAVACVGAFGLDNTYTGSNGWKLTLKDADIAAPTNVEVTQTYTGYKTLGELAAATAEGGTMDLTAGLTYEYNAPVVKYTGDAITAGTANYVSGIVANSAGEYVNYAKIGNTADGSAGVSVGFGTLADGTYKMFVFAEQANGDYQTDYASAFSNMDGYEFTKGSATVNEGTLSKGYAEKALTAKLGGDFNLSFENDTYNTGVTVGDGATGTITADETDGTTLTGNISVGTDATLTTANAFTLTGDNTVDGTVTGDALTIAGGTTTVGSTGKIENLLTITAGTVVAEGEIADATVKEGGTLEFNADKYGVTGGVENAALDGGTFKFTEGTLAKAVEGTGTTEIAGDVTANAKIETAITIDGSNTLAIAASNVGNTVTNAAGTLNLGAGSLGYAVSGNGATKITDDVTTGTNAAIANAVEIEDGKKLTLGADVTGTILVGTDAALHTNANYLKNTVTNNSDNSVHLTGGTVEHDITGTGTTCIDSGEVTNNAEIENSVNISNGATLSTDASKIATGAGETITNAGTLQFTAGTLTKGIDNSGAVTAKSGVTVNAEITNTGTTTLETGAAFGENGKITGGNVTLGEDVEFTASNLGTLASFTSQGTGAVYSFSATLGDTPLIAADAMITVSGNAAGTIKLGEIKLNGNSSDGWALGDTEEMQYLDAGTGSGLTINGTQWATSTDGKNYKYTFSQTKDGDANDKIGYMSVLKELGYTLPQIITNNPEGAGTEKGFYVNGHDTASVTKDLGALNNTLRGGKFTINGAADGTSILDGNGYGGIIAADTTQGGAEGDVLNLIDVTMKNFDTAVENKKGGIVSLENVTFKNSVGETDIINDGTLNINADVVLDKGVKGTGEMTLNDNFTNNTVIEQGKISVTGGKTLTNNGTITADIENAGTITTDADKISGSVKNSNKMILTGGTADETISEDSFAKLGSDVTGEGTTVIDGYVSAADKKLETAVEIKDDRGLYIKADGLKKTVANEGGLYLADGTLEQTVTGSGITAIRGNVEIGAEISQSNIVVETGSLTTNADLIKGGLINNETVNFTGGTLAKNYASTGTTNFKGKTAFSGAVSLTNSTVNFYLDGFKAGDTIVTSDKPAALNNAEIGLYQITDTDHKLTQKGDKITLISSAEGYGYTEEAPNLIDVQGGMVEDTYGVYQSTAGALEAAFVERGLADETKSFSEARLGASAALNAAGDFVAGDVADSMDNTEGAASAGAQSAGGWGSFASIGGSRGRYNTGSHVDLNSFNVAAGLSKKIKDNVTLGIFVEGGNGRYTTYNEFEDGEVRADGDVNYFGGGVLAKIKGKKTAKGQLHGEASFRAGRMNSDYNSETVIPDGNTRFDTSNAYMGAHAGLGYKWALKDNSNIDTYVKYLWNRQNSDTPTIAGEQFDLDAINSHRLRAGFRYNGKENENGVKFFGGLAYEYEFDGTAKGHMGEYSLLEPDFKGGSGMAELGIKYHKPNSPWKVELGVTGYTGKRDSIGANLNAWYEFDGVSKKQKIKEQLLPNTTLDAAPKTEIPAADIEQYKTPVTIDTTEEQEKPAGTPETVKKITTERQPVKTEVKQETNKQAKSAVQIGASPDKGACEGLAAKARKAGFDAKVITAQKGNATIYRVRVLSDSQTPEVLLKQVQAKGFSGFAVKD